MNQYQRIIRDGKVIQRGHIDTQKKFRQLTNGIDLAGKSVVDLGCNLGEMCRLAMDAGASCVIGIDERRDYIEDARKLNPDLSFDIRQAHRLTGSYDYAICSAMLHYFLDLRPLLKQLARCVTGAVLCDVWTDSTPDHSIRLQRERPLWIPTRMAWELLAFERFDKVEPVGKSLSPDGSARTIYHLSVPRRDPPEAVLIYGDGGAGKTTLAKTYHEHDLLQLDSVFLEWRIIHRDYRRWSVMGWVEQMRDGASYDEYMEFHERYISKWLLARLNRDVVIDGYDMIHEDHRAMVAEIMTDAGYKVQEIGL